MTEPTGWFRAGAMDGTDLRKLTDFEARPGEHHYRMADPQGNEFTLVLPPTPELVRDTYGPAGAPR